MWPHVLPPHCLCFLASAWRCLKVPHLPNSLWSWLEESGPAADVQCHCPKCPIWPESAWCPNSPRTKIRRSILKEHWSHLPESDRNWQKQTIHHPISNIVAPKESRATKSNNSVVDVMFAFFEASSNLPPGRKVLLEAGNSRILSCGGTALCFFAELSLHCAAHSRVELPSRDHRSVRVSTETRGCYCRLCQSLPSLLITAIFRFSPELSSVQLPDHLLEPSWNWLGNKHIVKWTFLIF